jgi:hypothetical protein
MQLAHFSKPNLRGILLEISLAFELLAFGISRRTAARLAT